MTRPSRAARRLAVLASVILLGSCGSLINSRFAGTLLAAAQDAQADSPGITGMIVDRTGDLLALEDDRTETIFCVSASPPPPPAFQPGVRVRVTGGFRNGILSARTIVAVGGSPWSPAAETADTERGITHVLVLMQENHSFDNYFGTFPGADGPPAGTVVEGASPYHLPDVVTSNMPHSAGAAQSAMNGGGMNRFVSAEGSAETMGYYDSRDIPNYWAYARRFALADSFFSSFAGPTLPNHLFLVAGQSPGVQTNVARPPGQGFTFSTLPDELEAAGVSWKSYVGQKDPLAFGALNPLAGFPSVAKGHRERLVRTSALFSDLRSGTLPAVGWIFPSAEESEHPLTDVRIGMWYVTAVVNALMKSSAWPHTVLVITWDEYGGFFDHVSPPARNGVTLGPRVPALVVSPYARVGFIDRTPMDFSSVMRFIEDRFGLPPLTAMDKDAASMAGMLDTEAHPDRLLIGSP